MPSKEPLTHRDEATDGDTEVFQLVDHHLAQRRGEGGGAAPLDCKQREKAQPRCQ